MTTNYTQSHSLQVLSQAPEATRWPSALKATATTALECPLRIPKGGNSKVEEDILAGVELAEAVSCDSCGVSGRCPQSRTVLSPLAVAMRIPTLSTAAPAAKATDLKDGLDYCF